MTAISSALRVTDLQFAKEVAELGEFVAIPSVSNPNSEDYNFENLQQAALFVASRLGTLGFKTRLTVVQEGTAPYVLAERIINVALPTLLLYGHYDVQPVERSHWNTDPFTMISEEGRLYGRGASDDKAGVMAILTALRVYKEAGIELPVNVKILIEGEEEYGSANMADLLTKEVGTLKADALVILDGGNRDVQTGTIENSSRGVVTMELKVNALEKPVHSGVGVLVPDPCQALAQLIVSLSDPRSIPGFLDGCEALSAEEKRLLAASSQTPAEYAREMGVVEGAVLRGSLETSIYERIVTEPSISVINMTSGQRGGGNSIQESARCTIGIRLTPGQDPVHVEEVVRRHLASQRMLYNVPYTLERIGLSSRAWKGNVEGPFTQAFLAGMQESYGQTAVMPTGGALPLIDDFKGAFPDLEVIVAGVEDPDTSAHSHNESQDIGVLRKTTDALISFIDRARYIPLRG
jgi:acetylornithine deacetylase/succinyl-diaminopimelate desuccinylase-like protein